MFVTEVLVRRCVWFACAQCRLYRTANPGISRRLKIFKQETPDLSKVKISEDDFDDLDVDIMNSGHLQKDYEREYAKIHKRIELQRIERQYFDKRKNPNFLLWSEKEQIRQLHSSEPENWTYDKLAESFPATPDVIKKIVEAQWKFKDLGGIKRHDNKVLANWKDYREGKLDLPEHLGVHLSKFTVRESTPKAKDCLDVMTIDEGEQKERLFPTRNREFVSIVQNYSKKSEPDAKESEWAKQESTLARPSETYVLPDAGCRKKHRATQYTLSEMRTAGKIAPSLTPEVSSSSTSSTSTSVAEDGDAPERVKGVIKPLDFFSTSRRVTSESSDLKQNDSPPDDIPMKITIPADKWKKGALYKVNNCFYADDGEFLYKI